MIQGNRILTTDSAVSSSQLVYIPDATFLALPITHLLMAKDSRACVAQLAC